MGIKLSELANIKFGMEEVQCQVDLEFSVSRDRGDKGFGLRAYEEVNLGLTWVGRAVRSVRTLRQTRRRVKGRDRYLWFKGRLEIKS